jgi:hypothetical protein
MNKILKYINNNEWKKVLKKYDPFEFMENTKNIFHYACMRGNKYTIEFCINKDNELIYISDDNGNTGAHLLAINNFYELLIKLVNRYPRFLILHNNALDYIHNIIYTDYDTLNKIIDIIIKNKYTYILTTKNISGYTFYYYLFDIIETNPKFTKILDKIWHYNELPFLAAKPQTLTYILKNYKININMTISKNTNILLYLIWTHQYNLIKFVLKKYRKTIDVNISGYSNTNIPLILLIKYNQIELVELVTKCKNVNYNLTDDKLNIPLYYLIKYIHKNKNDITITEFDKLINLLKIFVINSNLMHQNITLKTPYLYLIKSELWKYCKDELKDKKIDLHFLDKKGKSIISSFSSDEESNDFKNTIDIQKNNINMFEFPITLPDIIENNISIFNTSFDYNLIYMSYFITKYNVGFPLQTYNHDKYTYDKYILSFNQINSQTNKIFSFIKDTLRSSYCFYPVSIFWKNKYTYYVHPDIKMYIKRLLNMKDIKYIAIWTSLISDEFNHANIVIYNKKNNTLLRFEPYGHLYNFEDLDNFIINIFKSIKLTFTYYFPNDYLSKVKFQGSSQGDYYNNQNIGDPAGYCMAWCLWFLELIILNPDIDNYEQFVISALQTIVNKYNKIEYSLLHYIRGYSNNIMDNTNKILDKLNIDKYKKDLSDKSLNILSEYFINTVNDFFEKNISD